MLSSKRIGLVASLLITAALLGTVYFMINPVELSSDTVTYENGQSVKFHDNDCLTELPNKYESINLSQRTTINGGGTYLLEGKLSGTLTVNAPDGTPVILILNGVTIDGEDASAIEIQEAQKVVIATAEGSDNVLSSEGSSAVIFSRDDLTLTGLGTLTVNAGVDDGIKSNDGLKITGGTVNVTAGDEAIVANDYIIMRDGTLKLTSQSKAIKCENTEDEELGFISLEGGTLNIDTADDAIWASAEIFVSDTDAEIKAGDDALHAESTLALNGGKINVSECYEGFEGGNIVINNGDFTISARDDAFNATGIGVSGREMVMFGASSEVYLTINGGTIHAQSDGDGLDSNAAAVINGGYIEVYGPENNGNSTLDFDGGFTINGGTVITAGSSGMAESPSDESGQNVIVATLDNTYDAGVGFALVDSSGNTVVSGTSTKRFDWICISSADINSGETYSITVDGSAVSEITVDSAVTSVGNRAHGGMGGGGFRR